MFHSKPIHHLIQVVPRFALETRSVGHRSYGNLRWTNLLVDISTVSTTSEVLKLNPVGFVQQRRCGRVLDKSDVVTGVIFPEHFFAEHYEEDDEDKYNKEHHSYSDELLLAHVRMPCLNVGHHHGS